uniref:Uncharacterized protein n=1 Tax=Panagrellus redivivus TaxID=6233 RepID=A0A7E4VDM4_PANRE
MYPSVFLPFVFVFLTVNANDHYLFLRDDCRLTTVPKIHRSRVRFDLTRPHNTSCKDAEILQFTWSKVHYAVIASRLNETVVNIGIVPIEKTDPDKSIHVPIEPVDFSHVLEDCTFDEKTFAVGIFTRIMYFVASCESKENKIFGLARATFDFGGNWYVPYGPLIRVDVGFAKPDGTFFWNPERKANLQLVFYQLWYDIKDVEDTHLLDVRNLHSLNETAQLKYDATDIVRVVKFRSSNGKAKDNAVWDYKDTYGCTTTFLSGIGAFQIQSDHNNQINVPCTYRVQRVTVVNDETNFVQPISWKYIDVQKQSQSATFECSKHSSEAGKKVIKCKKSPWTIVMAVLVGIEVLFLVVIGVTTLMMYLKQKWSKRPKKIKIIKYIKKSAKESKKEVAPKKAVSKKDEKKNEKPVVNAKKP